MKLLGSTDGSIQWELSLPSDFYLHQRGMKDPVSYFMTSVTNLWEHALRNCDDSDMVGISTRNEVNMNKAIGISFRRIDHSSADVILNTWEKVTQSNSRFNVLDTYVFEVLSLMMPVGFGRSIKTKGRLLATLPHLKKHHEREV